MDKYLNKIGANHPGVTLLKTIPGVGPRTAEALVAYIDDARRFGGLKRAGAYFGLVPCQDASADKNRLGHITRDGPGTVRKLLCEAAWTGVRCSPTIRSYYQRLTHDDPDRKKIAIVATAHHLVRVAVSMLKTGQCWKESTKENSSPKIHRGGGENPSRPQGFSPPPGTCVGAQEASPPPPLSASPFSPEAAEGHDSQCEKLSHEEQTVEKPETVGA